MKPDELARAWREAARCWQEYRAWTDDSDEGRAVRQMLHDSAWAAENHWRALYDAQHKED